VKVAVVSSKYPPEYSGSGLRAHNTYLRLRDKFDIEFDVITGTSLSDESTHLVLDDVVVTSFAIPYRMLAEHRSFFVRHLSLLRLYRRVWRRLSKIQPDVIHLFGKNEVTVAASMYAKFRKVPLIVEVVNDTGNIEQAEPRYISWILGSGYRSNARIVCLSDAIASVAKSQGYSEENIWIRPNPVREDRFKPEYDSRDKLRDELTPFGASDVVLLCVAKFIPRKKQDFLVSVVSKLPSHFKLILAGPLVSTGPLASRDQKYFREIQDRIDELGVTDRVFLISEFVEHPERLMNASDVFVFPAVNEAFGTPFAEALACGIPVVMNDRDDVYGRYVDGSNGMLVPLDADRWAAAVLELVKIPIEQRTEFSKRILSQSGSSAIDQAYVNLLHR
jgi:glycosyltransferase involved in cell wall biosynthesis